MAPYHFAVALRYLKSRKRHKSLSLTAAISTGGVALGVMALLIVLSVMSGFHEDLQKKILGATAHVIIQDFTGTMRDYEGVAAKIRDIKHVEGYSPFVLGQVMISRDERAQGVILRGIEPELEAKTTDIEGHMKLGRFNDLGERDGLSGILLGSELAAKLGALPGDTVRIISPMGEMGPMGMMPRVREFRVSGVFEIGMYEFDSTLVLTGLAPAQEFFRMDGAVSGVQLKLDDVNKAKEVSEESAGRLGYSYYARNWMDMHKNLFAALKLEKLAMFVILTLIVLVAAFNIVSTLTMSVIEKEAEIAILMTMGASRKGIMAIFMLQGFLVGIVGTAIGLSGGWLAGYLMNEYQIIRLPADVYYLSYLPARMNLFDFIAVSVSAVVISFAATVYPAWQASRLNPVEPLRYE